MDLYPVIPQDLRTTATPTFAGLTLDDGVLEIPSTTSTIGQITQNSTRIFHTFLPSTATPIYENIFLGENSGNFTLDNTAPNPEQGSANIGIGSDTLQSLTSGWLNTAIGQEAGKALTSGHSNFCLGGWSGLALTTGYANVLIGRNAGVVMTDGHDNMAIGGYSLDACISGTYNVALGNYALTNCTSSFNIAIGANTLFSGTSIAGNVAIGYLSGASITTGDYNIYLGYAAGRYQTTLGHRLIIDSYSRGNAATELTHPIIYGIMGQNPEDQSIIFNLDEITVGTDTTNDIVFTFAATAGNSGVLTWTQAGDYFKFSDDILLNSTEKIYLNDTNTYIYDDGTDLNLITNGVLKFGSHSAIGAETVTGYITIKDAAGNSRKLAVIS